MTSLPFAPLAFPAAMFPAELAMKRDRAIPPSARRVYDYLLTALDFTQIRPAKEDVHAPLAGVDPKTFRAGVTLLIDRGYLIDHGREMHNVRRLTLAWSLASPTARDAG